MSLVRDFPRDCVYVMTQPMNEGNAMRKKKFKSVGKPFKYKGKTLVPQVATVCSGCTFYSESMNDLSYPLCESGLQCSEEDRKDKVAVIFIER